MGRGSSRGETVDLRVCDAMGRCWGVGENKIAGRRRGNLS